MDKQLATAAYWIGIISTILAIIMRGLAVLGVSVFTQSPGKLPLTYRTFFDGAELFFLMAIAASVIIWARTPKT